MFRRRRTGTHGPSTVGRPAIGIGAMVVVLDESGAADRWVGEPSGVVVHAGHGEVTGYPGLGFGATASWLVAFDELAWTVDGRGPFEHASVPARRLRLAPALEPDADHRIF